MSEKIGTFKFLSSYNNSFKLFKNNFSSFLKTWLTVLFYCFVIHLLINVVLHLVAFRIHELEFSALNFKEVIKMVKSDYYYVFAYNVLFALLLFPIVLSLNKLCLNKISGSDLGYFSVKSFLLMSFARRMQIALVIMGLSVLLSGLSYGISYLLIKYNMRDLIVHREMGVLVLISTIGFILGLIYMEFHFLLNYFFVDNENEEFKGFINTLKFLFNVRNIGKLLLLLINLFIIWFILLVLLIIVMSPFVYVYYYMVAFKWPGFWILGGIFVSTVFLALVSVCLMWPYIYIGLFYNHFCRK